VPTLLDVDRAPVVLHLVARDEHAGVVGADQHADRLRAHEGVAQHGSRRSVERIDVPRPLAGDVERVSRRVERKRARSDRRRVPAGAVDRDRFRRQQDLVQDGARREVEHADAVRVRVHDVEPRAGRVHRDRRRIRLHRARIGRAAVGVGTAAVAGPLIAAPPRPALRRWRRPSLLWLPCRRYNPMHPRAKTARRRRIS
jgi:hypothetical protein